MQHGMLPTPDASGLCGSLGSSCWITVVLHSAWVRTWSHSRSITCLSFSYGKGWYIIQEGGRERGSGERREADPFTRSETFLLYLYLYVQLSMLVWLCTPVHMIDWICVSGPEIHITHLPWSPSTLIFELGSLIEPEAYWVTLVGW